VERTKRQQLEKKAKFIRSENSEHRKYIKEAREKILTGTSERPLLLFNLLIKLNKEIQIISEDIVLKKGSYTININKISQLRLKKRKIIKKLSTINTANVFPSKKSNEQKRLWKPEHAKRKQPTKYNDQVNRDFNKLNKQSRTINITDVATTTPH
jgi:hypothetical protein